MERPPCVAEPFRKGTSFELCTLSPEERHASQRGSCTKQIVDPGGALGEVTACRSTLDMHVRCHSLRCIDCFESPPDPRNRVFQCLSVKLTRILNSFDYLHRFGEEQGGRGRGT